MDTRKPIPLVQCRLIGSQGDRLRYVPLVEFGLWRHLMESRHSRTVEIEEISIWLEEKMASRSQLFPRSGQPVLLLRLELPGPWGVSLPVERFVAAEDLDPARQALVHHYGLRMRPEGPTATRGFFVPGPTRAAADP